MSVPRELLGLGLRASDAIRRRCFFWHFLIRGWPLSRRLHVGRSNSFYVPVRSDGAGSLVIGDRNSFGFRMAPKMGSGEILLQARQPDAIISIGCGNYISNNASLLANHRITIGDNCLIGDLVAIYDSDFHEVDPSRRRQGRGQSLPVQIGNNVWLGSRVMILKGVTIGENSVVGAMSLVTKSLPANSVAAGVPAKLVRSFERQD